MTKLLMLLSKKHMNCRRYFNLTSDGAQYLLLLVMFQTIGHGASGQVYLAKHKKNGQKFACKIINKDGNMNDAQRYDRITCHGYNVTSGRCYDLVVEYIFSPMLPCYILYVFLLGFRPDYSMSTEIEIMKRVRHRHVCSMFELYESPKCLWIILELVDGGDLHKLLATTKHYSEDLASRHMEQMLKVFAKLVTQ